MWSNSAIARLGGFAWRRFQEAWRVSLLGRFLGACAAVLALAAGGSLLLSTGSVRSRPLAAGASAGSGPVALRILAVPYVWLGRLLGESAIGRTFRRAGRSINSSSLAVGGWLAAAGAAAIGMGISRLVAGARAGAAWPDQMGAVFLMLAGLLAVGGGPLMFPAATRRRSAAVMGSVLALGLAAALLAGFAPGASPLVVTAAGVFVCAAVFSLYRPEGLLLAFAAFPWLDWVARKSLGPLGPAFHYLLLVGTMMALLFCVLVIRRWDLRTVPLTIPFLVAVVVAIGSVMLTGVPQDVGVFALRITFAPILLYFIGYLLPKDRRWVKWTVGVFLAASLALALHGLFQYVTHAPMPASWVDIHEKGSIGTRAYSIVQNPNGLGAFLLLGSLLAVSLAFSRLRTRFRVLAAAAAVVLIAGLGVTFSRGAWVGFVVGLLALAALSARRLLAALIVAGIISPVVLPRQIISRLAFVFSSAYLAKSATAGRLYVWRIALQRIVDHPWLGVGLGSFGGTSAFIFGYTKLWVDNFYLQLAAEGGLVLLLVFLWMLLRVAKGLVVTHGEVSDPFLRAVVAGAFGGIVAVAFANLTASVWETLVVGTGFWFLAGFASSLTAETAKRPLSAVRDMRE